ncbi:hypothetical protein SDJN02_18187, partial [Cucurbita argyrosperma subsp. argyrosperma]
MSNKDNSITVRRRVHSSFPYSPVHSISFGPAKRKLRGFIAEKNCAPLILRLAYILRLFVLLCVSMWSVNALAAGNLIEWRDTWPKRTGGPCMLVQGPMSSGFTLMKALPRSIRPFAWPNNAPLRSNCAVSRVAILRSPTIKELVYRNFSLYKYTSHSAHSL